MDSMQLYTHAWLAGWAVNEDDARCRVRAKTVDADDALWLFCRRGRSSCPPGTPITYSFMGSTVLPTS